MTKTDRCEHWIMEIVRDENRHPSKPFLCVSCEQTFTLDEVLAMREYTLNDGGSDDREVL